MPRKLGTADFTSGLALASWRKFLDDNQFENGYQNAAELTRFYGEFTDRMREILKDAGIKTVR
jgi:tripartite-type tricarboxylate transporter receptor subunit TctC